MSSADMSSPRPHPRPAWAPEKNPNDGQTNSDSNEPRHYPPGEGFRGQPIQPPLLSLPNGIRKKQKRRNECRGSKNRPSVEYRKKREEDDHSDQDGPQILRRPASPDRLAFDIHVEIRNDHERDHHQCRNQYSGHEWREKVQEFLEAEKIPRGLGGIRGKQRIRQLLGRRVSENRNEHPNNHKPLRCDLLAQQKMSVSQQLGAGNAQFLARGLLRDKTDSAWLLLRVRAKAGLDFILFHRRPWALRSDRRPFAHARNESR